MPIHHTAICTSAGKDVPLMDQEIQDLRDRTYAENLNSEKVNLLPDGNHPDGVFHAFAKNRYV